MQALKPSSRICLCVVCLTIFRGLSITFGILHEFTGLENGLPNFHDIAKDVPNSGFRLFGRIRIRIQIAE